jgi:hypothetical protein
MDLVLGGLYYRYEELFRPGIAPDALKPLVIAFIETARAFIDGNGVYDPWVRPPEPEQAAEAHSPVSQDKPEPEKPGTRKSPEEVWDDFTVYLERMISVQTAFDSGVSPAESRCAGLGYAYASLALLRAVIGAENGVPGNGIFDGDASGADAVSLAVHWQLDRKLREILCRLGLDGESARYAVEILKAALSRGGAGKSADETARAPAAKTSKTAPDVKRRSAKDLARQVILDNYGADDFRRILGINVFDDVAWFNKEAFERALYYGSIYAAMENGDAALIKNTAAELEKAKERSGYRLDALIEALSGDADKRGKSHRVKK